MTGTCLCQFWQRNHSCWGPQLVRIGWATFISRWWVQLDMGETAIQHTFFLVVKHFKSQLLNPPSLIILEKFLLFLSPHKASLPDCSCVTYGKNSESELNIGQIHRNIYLCLSRLWFGLPVSLKVEHFCYFMSSTFYAKLLKNLLVHWISVYICRNLE